MAPSRVPNEETYDYIICGGGTSGCVLAGRLAESDPTLSILLVEAGADNADLESTHMAGGWAQLFGTDGDWKIKNEPLKHANDRTVDLFRGRFLGGSSGCNGCLTIRGTKQDYDDWDVPGWSGDEIFAYMRKSETFHGKEWFKAAEAEHGYDGPLHTEPHDLAPISQRVRDAMLEKGLPWHEDMFVTGEVPHGVGHAVRTHHEGFRSTAADFVTKTYRRENVTIRTQMVVDRVVIEKIDGLLRATGAELVARDGSRSTVRASGEVVVSGGAYCTPTILMRSGIGAKDELAEHNIECLVDLPGIGKNLMDHPLSFMFYEVNDPALTLDRMVYEEGSFASTYQLWKDEKKGMLSIFPFGIFAWLRLDERLKGNPLWEEAKAKAARGRDAMGLTSKQPHIELWNTELYGGGPQYTDFPVNKKAAFAMCVLLFNANSRGYVKLRKDDPLGPPVVDSNYLADPLDELVLSEGCKIANEILMESKPTSEVIKGAWPETLTHHKNTSREEWVGFVKETVGTCYHPSGTAKMVDSKKDDPMGVVDERLRVKGVEGLRVVDVSIMPVVNNGHTQMPAYAIGEKAAAMMREDAKR